MIHHAPLQCSTIGLRNPTDSSGTGEGWGTDGKCGKYWNRCGDCAQECCARRARIVPRDDSYSLLPAWTHRFRSCVSGGNASSNMVWKAFRRATGEAVRLAFPPGVVVSIKAFACELPAELVLPLSRLSMADIRDETIRRGLVASVGNTTLWRWLSGDAIRPWFHRTWIFPRDPQFAEKAGRILDLYEGLWDGAPLKESDCVVSADEKTSIQARRRIHPASPPFGNLLVTRNMVSASQSGPMAGGPR